MCLIRNNEIGNHALPNLLLPPHHPPPTRVESAAKSPALIHASGPRPVSCSSTARSRGAGSVQRLPLLSSHGPLAIRPSSVRCPPRPPPSSDPRGRTCASFLASSARLPRGGGLGAGAGAHTGTAAHVHFLMAEPGWGEEGLVPLQYLFCEVC